MTKRIVIHKGRSPGFTYFTEMKYVPIHIYHDLRHKYMACYECGCDIDCRHDPCESPLCSECKKTTSLRGYVSDTSGRKRGWQGDMSHMRGVITEPTEILERELEREKKELNRGRTAP